MCVSMSPDGTVRSIDLDMKTLMNFEVQKGFAALTVKSYNNMALCCYFPTYLRVSEPLNRNNCFFPCIIQSHKIDLCVIVLQKCLVPTILSFFKENSVKTF